ncbi:hypothetical protein HPB48_025381 [Haemaphysalis longicornis]|uniref:Uncharacterized protein n=1 Tax=Haemaphysalis longicornis TaxID=44386 RepID=A0A9J6HA83_HAELO|nr:hypothetical protein HPB48_025381 [Haemaphysalis longicornis]
MHFVSTVTEKDSGPQKHLEASTKSFRRLRRYCQTSLVKRHDSVALSEKHVLRYFAHLKSSWTPSMTKRPPHIASISESFRSTFFLCLADSETFLGLIYHLSLHLQSQDTDMTVTLEQVVMVLTKFEEIGANVEAEIHKRSD